VTNLKAFEADDQMPFLDTVVALVIGVLFIAVPATIHASSILDVLAGSVALTAVLVLVQRPVVAMLATRGKGLARSERAFIGWMAPRGIVAAATAAVLDPQLAAAGIPGAHHLLPITFLVVALTAIVYSSTARPIAVSLGVAGDLAGDGAGEEHPAVA
jgi:NhaP-type Na+/H+ or K+/H+ antiporter